MVQKIELKLQASYSIIYINWIFPCLLFSGFLRQDRLHTVFWFGGIGLSPELSIIIPIYNLADLIRDTLDCILAQSYTNFELILVDDGSSDGTVEILRDYQARDARVRLIQQANAGPAAARNTGIDAATGRRILFVDGDDTIQPDALAFIAEKTAETDCDLMIFGFRTKNISGATDFLYTYPESLLSDSASLSAHFADLYQSNLLNQVWNKVYRTELLRAGHCRFLDYRYGEDRLFVFDVLPRCKTIYISDRCLYNYFIRSKESLVSKFCAEKFEVCNRFDETIQAFLAAHQITDEKSVQEINYMYLKSILSCETNLFLPSCPYSRSEKRRHMRGIITNDQVRAAVRRYQKHGFVMNTIVRIFRTENCTLNVWMASAISFISRHFSTVFIRAKHPEAQSAKE